MEETPVTPAQSAKPTPSILANYMYTLGKSEDEILQTLKLCYKEPDKEIKVVETFDDLEDF